MSLGLAILEAIQDLRAIKVGDEDDERDVVDIDNDSGFLVLNACSLGRHAAFGVLRSN